MNLAGLDLNLLTALEALLAEGHVGRAAQRVGLSQPAMSHALRRLRESLDDPLLVRVGGGMELTPRAEALRLPLAEALDQVRGLFRPEHFDPATSRRRFAVMMPDHVVDIVIAPLLERLAVAAPQVALDVVPWSGSENVTADLARQVDLVIACTGDAFPGFRRQHLYRDSDALAVRRGHPVGAALAVPDRFLAARHVAVVGRGIRQDPIDSWLHGQGLARQIAMTVPGYIQALHMAARSDLVAFLPGRLIRALGPKLGVDLVPPPLDPGGDVEFMFHPARQHREPASIWLRHQVLAVGRMLEDAAAEACAAATGSGGQK